MYKIIKKIYITQKKRNFKENNLENLIQSTK